MTETLDRAVSIGEIFRALLRYWRIVVASTVVCCGLAVLLIVTTTPVYRAEALVKPARPMSTMAGAGSLFSQMGGGLASLVGFTDSADELTNEALAVMHSRAFILSFIEANNLMPVLFEDSWDIKSRDWKAGLEREPTSMDGYYYFANRVFDAFKDRKSGFVKVQVDWTDRTAAAQWVNLLISKLNQDMRAKATQEANDTLTYLDMEHSTTDSVAVQSAIFSMMESQLKAKTMAAVRKQYAFEVIDPAFVPDEKTVLRPRKLLYLAVGLLLGGLLGGAIAVIVNSRRLVRLRSAAA